MDNYILVTLIGSFCIIWDSLSDEFYRERERVSEREREREEREREI
jgi:hypothetical protein